MNDMEEDEVRDQARDILGLMPCDGVKAGAGQITTFNKLGFKKVYDKPDGWWLPDNVNEAALVLEAKATIFDLDDKKWVDEICKTIKLPATSSGEPDWDYMEQYMSEVMQGSEASLEALRRADSSKHKIDATGWSEFPIPSLFETERKGKRVQVPTGAWVAKKDLTEGDIPRITVSGFGNGIVGRFGLSNSKDYRLYENFISVSFLGTVFYQPEAASLDMKVHCLKPLDHTLNTLTGCFLVSVIRNTIAKYVYGDQLSSEVLASLSLKLPATSSGEPDWDYMEQYMSEVMQGSEASLEALE